MKKVYAVADIFAGEEEVIAVFSKRCLAEECAEAGCEYERRIVLEFILDKQPDDL